MSLRSTDQTASRPQSLPQTDLAANLASLNQMDGRASKGTQLPVLNARRNEQGGTASASMLAQAGKPTPLQSAGKTIAQVADALTPSAIVLGGSHDLPVGGRAGNFTLIDRRTGNQTYFGTKPLSPRIAPELASGFFNKFKLGGAVPAISLVGTNGAANGDEAGLGLSWKVPTRAGDLLVFANLRQDRANLGNLIDTNQGKGDKSFTGSVNIGAAYSLSDGALIGLGTVAGGPVGNQLATMAAPLTPVDAWAGAAYRGSMKFENGKPVSVTLNDIEIPFNKLPEVLGKAAEKTRQSPPLIANKGSSAIASKNDNIQLVFGQSPWDVGLAAQAKTKSGALAMSNGTVDVRNHGNSVTTLTEPVYELGVKHGALKPGQRIKNNQEAGAVIDKVLAQASALDQRNVALGKKSNAHTTARDKFMNPYFLSMGSKTLQMEYGLFQRSGAYQALTNGSRILQKLPMLPVGAQKPKDFAFVKSAFQGEMRFQGDNPPKASPSVPSSRYGF
jgi:hypothetical protein